MFLPQLLLELNNGTSIRSAILKATNNGLTQQLHLSPSDINILLTIVLCTSLKPNGKFSDNFFYSGWDMGLTNFNRERIGHLECICVYCCLAIYI